MLGSKKGFGSLQLLMGLATMGLASVVAVPQYEAYAGHGKIAQALEYAGGPVQDISHYFIDNGNFPKYQSEITAITTKGMKAPGFVKNLAIIPGPRDMPEDDYETYSLATPEFALC